MRHVNQVRPKGDPEAFPYSPQRDLANIYLPMLVEAVSGLDPENMPAEYCTWMETEGITLDVLSEAVKLLVETHQQFIRNRDIKTPADAFAVTGFLDLPWAVKGILFSRIGEVLIGGFFVGVRDVTLSGYSSPTQADMAELIAAGRELSRVLSGHAPHRPEAAMQMMETAIADHEETKRVLAQAQTMLQAKQQLFNVSQQTLQESEARVAAAEAKEEEFQSAMQEAHTAYDELSEQTRSLTATVNIWRDAIDPIQKNKGWRRIAYAIRFAWLLYWR